MGYLDLKLKIASHSKFSLAYSHHGLGQKGGIIPLCLSLITGLSEKGGIIPYHKGILGSLQFRENKETIVSLTIYINTAPAHRTNKNTGESFFSSLVGVSNELKGQIPQADVLNWSIQTWENMTIDAQVAELIGFTTDEPADEVIVPKHEAIDAFFQAAKAGGLKLAIVCDNVQHGQVTEGVNPNTGKNERRMAIWPEGEFTVELFKPVAKASVSSASLDRLRGLKAPAPVAQGDPFTV
jgi:hypothetical protein